MAKRAKGLNRGPTKATAKRNDITSIVTKKRVQSPKILSSEDSQAVGRPGFGGKVPGPVDGKDSVKRVRQIDPARGITLPGADVITSSSVDLVGKLRPRIMSQALVAPMSNAKKTVKRAGNRLRKR